MENSENAFGRTLYPYLHFRRQQLEIFQIRWQLIFGMGRNRRAGPAGLSKISNFSDPWQAAFVLGVRVNLRQGAEADCQTRQSTCQNDRHETPTQPYAAASRVVKYFQMWY